MRRTVPPRRALRAPAPQASLRLLVAAWIVVAGGACGPREDGGSVAAPDGSLRGALSVTISDDFDGRAETHFALRAPDGRERPLVFDVAPDLAPGSDVRVWGLARADGLHVTRVEPASPAGGIARVTSALRSAPAYEPRSFAFVLVDLGGGVNTTVGDVTDRLITGGDSIRNYFIADSYGTQDVTAQVFGPIRYALANGCDTAQLATDLRPMIPGTFDHYLWYFGSRQTACGWTGLASVGTPDKPSHDTWYNASTSCVVLVQEPGHNFGMQHSSSLACPNATLADDPNTCTASEYGDLFDPMGGGCRHMNAWQKDYQGWFGACNGVTVTSTGTFTLLPLEQRCDGVQFLKIPAQQVRTFNRPAGGGGPATVETLSDYYVELRTGQDFDGTLGNRAALAPQVLLHIGGELRDRDQRGLHTFLLDATPATTGRAGFEDAALGAGKTFTDPAGGLSIAVRAVSATQATIEVQLEEGTGAPTCLDGTPFTAPGPGQESCTALVAGAGGAPDAGDAGDGLAGAGGADAGGATGASGASGEAGAGGASGTAGAPDARDADAPSSTGAAGVGAPTDAGGTGTSAAGASGAIPPGAASGVVVGRGCACAAGGGPSSGGGATTLVVALALAGRRRRRRLSP
jgi:MYXO-CTERM domain-containing protein